MAMHASTSFARVSLPAVQPCCLFHRGPRHPASSSDRAGRGPQKLQARGGRGEQGRLQQSMEPSSPFPNVLARTPWYVSAPAALLAVGLALQIFKRMRGEQGSLNDLEYRGLVSNERNVANNDPFYDKAMKNVRTIKIEELSEEQIMAARKRRSREREGDEMDLSKMELPSNHPFAVAEQVTEEEEELQRARLRVRRGPPLQDLSGTRGFPEDRPPQTPGRRPRPAAP